MTAPYTHDSGFLAQCAEFHEELKDPSTRARMKALFQSDKCPAAVAARVSNVREHNMRRNELTNALEKKVGALKDACVGPILASIRGAISLKVEALTDPAVCDICRETIPFPRRLVLCGNEMAKRDRWGDLPVRAKSGGAPADVGVRERTFTVRSDFVPILTAYYVLCNWEEVVKKKMEGVAELDDALYTYLYELWCHSVELVQKYTARTSGCSLY